MSKKVYKIGFVPLDAFGHVNACLGLAKNLRERGHNCVFIANQKWEDMITKYGFQYKKYIEEHKLGGNGDWDNFFTEHGHTLKLSPFEKIRKLEATVWPIAINDVKGFTDKITFILNNIK